MKTISYFLVTRFDIGEAGVGISRRFDREEDKDVYCRYLWEDCDIRAFTHRKVKEEVSK